MQNGVRRNDMAVLLLRVAGFCLLCFGHGTMKIGAALGQPGSSFPDPLGLGQQLGAIMAMGAECVMSLAVAMGLYTRLCTLPIMFTMATVATLVHEGGPWLKREPSVLYLLLYTAILILGPGAYSIDAWWRQRQQKNATC